MTETFKVATGMDSGFRRLMPERWNTWRLNPEVPALIYDGNGYSNGYQIDLDRMLTPAAMLFWILQIHHKPWGPEAVTGLVTAIDDILNPQPDIYATDAPARTLDTVRERVAAFVAKGERS